MRTIKFRDTIQVNGNTKNALIMRDGVYIYLASEVEENPADPFKRLVIYRPAEEVKKAYERFKELGRVPVIYNHPDHSLDLNDSNSFSQGYGVNPIMTKDDGDNTNIKCTLHLMGDALNAYKNKGIKEISCGWSGTFEDSTSDSYDYIQRFEDFNHIAIVPEGRCGSTCAIQDKKSIKEKNKMLFFGKKKRKIHDEDVIEQNPEEQMQDAESCITAMKDFIENPDEEHKEAALQALDGLTRFLKAEANESVTDEEVEEEIKEKVEDAKKTVIKRYHDVLPFILNHTISLSEINDSMTPCEIKSLIIKKHTGVAPKENLDKAFKEFADSFQHRGWMPTQPIAKNVVDAAVDAINSIGIKKENK